MPEVGNLFFRAFCFVPCFRETSWFFKIITCKQNLKISEKVMILWGFFQIIVNIFYENICIEFFFGSIKINNGSWSGKFEIVSIYLFTGWIYVSIQKNIHMAKEAVSSALSIFEFYLIFIYFLIQKVWLPYLLMHKWFVLFGANTTVHFILGINLK